jgi:VHS domain
MLALTVGCKCFRFWICCQTVLLQLLDILVKNCGYPFHLQIATKDFLNELVRRFPEKPPVFSPPPMAKILELVHEWKLTICTTSKYKEDLVHIRDMHRLLSYKGEPSLSVFATLSGQHAHLLYTSL